MARVDGPIRTGVPGIALRVYDMDFPEGVSYEMVLLSGLGAIVLSVQVQSAQLQMSLFEG